MATVDHQHEPPQPRWSPGTRSAFNPRALRTWHQESGMRLEQVCVLTGVSYPYLRGLTTGLTRSPSIRLLERLAAVYDRDIGELFTADPDPAGAR